MDKKTVKLFDRLFVALETAGNLLTEIEERVTEAEEKEETE